MTGMKFRRSCDKCNATFFSTDRKARYCSKHQPKTGVAPAPATASPAPASGGGYRSFEPREQHRPQTFQKTFNKSNKFVAGSKPRPQGRSQREKPPAKPPRPPQATELTTELRARIAGAFQSLQNVPGTDTPITNQLAELNLRNIHTQISQQLWVKRSLVSQVLREIRSALAVTAVDLTPEQYNQAAERYAYFVATGERPEGGRRRMIAQELNVPLKTVVLAIRKWAQEQYAKSPTPQPTREQLFEIEKCYWKHMKAGKSPYEKLPEAIAGELNFVTSYQVLRWIDVLHDDTKIRTNLPEITPEQQKKILAAYQDYLKAGKPPEMALHPTIAKSVGASSGQVHRVLYDYRVAQRTAYRDKHALGQKAKS